MKVHSWEELGEGKLSGLPFAATIGVFDGLHVGHRELVKRILGNEGLASAVLTFRENPKRILSPTTHPGELSTLDQKLELIESMGVDICVLIDFSGDFSKLPGRRFLSLLKKSGELRFLAVGSNFRCGQGLDTDAEGIRSFCEGNSIGIELVQAVQWAGHPVSSSRIRKAVLDGRLGDAASMLGRPYEIDLRGSSLSASGCIAANGAQARPPRGVYDATLAYGDGSELSVSARIEAEGCWSFVSKADGSEADGEDRGVSEDRAPKGLRLIRLVSRV
jgi:riboflavin kinase / FMN adenylyltransferase